MKQISLEYRYNKMPVMKELLSMESFCNTNLDNVNIGFVRDHDRIDLGNKELEVIHIPGHSYGSIALLDRNDKRIFTGDMITKHNIWYFLSADEQAPFYMALNSYRKVKAMEDTIEQIYSAHGEVPIQMDCVEDLIACFEYELRENFLKDKEFKSFMGNGYQHFFKSVNLIYSDARLSEYLEKPIIRV